MSKGKAREHAWRAIELFQQGKVVESQELCHQVLLDNPNQFDALHLLVVIACQGGQLDRGVELLTRATGINPKAAAVHSDRGNALMKAKRWDEALASFDRAIALKPDFAVAHNNRARVLEALQRPDEAIASYDKVIQHRPDDAQAYFNRGKV